MRTIASLLVLTCPLALAEFPEFEIHTIDHWGNKLGQTALVDMDDDGDLDWVVGCASHAGAFANQIAWWEFKSPTDWERHTLGMGNSDVGGDAFDVDGDGWVDFVSGSVFLLNTGNPFEPFKAFEVGTIYSHDTEFGDINGDDRMDLIANSDRSGLFWYEIPEDPTHEWKTHTIAGIEDHKVHGGVSPNSVGDIDGDGDPDVVTARVWYENLGGGLNWKPHANINFGEDHKYGVAVRTWIGKGPTGSGDNYQVDQSQDRNASRIFSGSVLRGSLLSSPGFTALYGEFYGLKCSSFFNQSFNAFTILSLAFNGLQAFMFGRNLGSSSPWIED